jgi:hypothetical protein
MESHHGRKLAQGHLIRQIGLFPPTTTIFALTPQMSNAPLQNPLMKCEQVNYAGGGNPDTEGYSIIHEAQFTPKEDELPMRNALPINEALQIKAAEYWLKLGVADFALKELEALPSRIWRCGWAVKTRIAVIGALRGKDEMTVQA